MFSLWHRWVQACNACPARRRMWPAALLGLSQSRSSALCCAAQALAGALSSAHSEDTRSAAEYRDKLRAAIKKVRGGVPPQATMLG
jgi:hypothetical protein